MRRDTEQPSTPGSSCGRVCDGNRTPHGAHTRNASSPASCTRASNSRGVRLPSSSLQLGRSLARMRPSPTSGCRTCAAGLTLEHDLEAARRNHVGAQPVVG